MKRKSPKKRWQSPSAPTRLDNGAADAVEPVNLRAVRDDAGLAIVAIPTPFEERDAIDRLLDNSGFDDVVPVKGQVAELDTLDDFEPHFDTAFTVASLDNDPHLQIQPLPEYEVESFQDLTFSAKPDDADPIPVAVAPAPADAKDLFVDTEWFAEPLNDQAVPATGAVALAGAGVDEGMAAQAGGRLGPVVEMSAAVDSKTRAESFFVGAGTAEVNDGPLFEDSQPDPNTEHYSVQEKIQPIRPLFQPAIPDAGRPELAVSCKGPAAQAAKLNMFLLVLSLVSSLVTLVLFFLLMDMREDLVKLNEMLDIMKDDIQMLREDTPNPP